LNTARTYIESGGTSTAALGFGGSNPGGYLGNTESYNGSSWTEVNDMNTARQAEGSGTQTSALAYLGFNGTIGSPNLALTESWNGTSWTEVADANTARRYGASVGADNTNALAIGGYDVGLTNIVESWNGTSWTEVGDFNTTRYVMMAGGTNTSALMFGGSPPTTGATESWNGTSWTEVADLNVAKGQGAGSGADNTSALSFAGTTSPGTGVVTTEEWDGTSWTETSDMSTGRYNLAGSGTTASSLASGGQTPGVSAATEEWIKPSFITRTITSS